ncbi:1-phosphatidylinositol-5-phosphate 4-kinase, partial [Clonorchis sinensis]
SSIRGARFFWQPGTASTMTTVSKQKKVKNVKQKLKLFRANEPLKSVLMWGINYSFSALNHVKPRAMLLKDDFKAYMKVKINNHLFNKENMPSRFKFKEYCPIVFKALRARFGVNKLDYWDAFTGYQPLWDSARGKSGSKFLVTYNRQFVAKAISSEEVEQMHNLLEDYYAYIVHCHGQTLLPQYLGLYRLTVNDQETYILVMRNVFSPRLTIHKKYDLKGSAVDREANEKEKAKPLPTLKDNDFLNEVCKIYIGEEAKSKLLSRLESDVQFLQENNLMDYSLLIGIHEVDRASEAAASSDEAGGTDQDGAVDDRTASAGDGLGSLTSQWHLRRLSTGRRSVDPCVVALAGSQTGGYRSAGDEDDEDEGGVFSDPGIPIPGAIEGVPHDLSNAALIPGKGKPSRDQHRVVFNRLVARTLEENVCAEEFGSTLVTRNVVNGTHRSMNRLWISPKLSPRSEEKHCRSSYKGMTVWTHHHAGEKWQIRTCATILVEFELNTLV